MQSSSCQLLLQVLQQLCVAATCLQNGLELACEQAVNSSIDKSYHSVCHAGKHEEPDGVVNIDVDLQPYSACGGPEEVLKQPW